MHGDANIRRGSLNRWLPMNHRELPELLEIEFEAIFPAGGRKQHDQRYTLHPIIRNFLDETVRERSVDGVTVNGFGWIMLETAKNPHIKTMNICKHVTAWFLRATARLPPGPKCEDVLYEQKTRQTTSLQAASYVAYACSYALGPDSEQRCAVQLEMIVHSKQRRRFRWRTLLG